MPVESFLALLGSAPGGGGGADARTAVQEAVHVIERPPPTNPRWVRFV